MSLRFTGCWYSKRSLILPRNSSCSCFSLNSISLHTAEVVKLASEYHAGFLEKRGDGWHKNGYKRRLIKCLGGWTTHRPLRLCMLQSRCQWVITRYKYYTRLDEIPAVVIHGKYCLLSAWYRVIGIFFVYFMRQLRCGKLNSVIILTYVPQQRKSLPWKKLNKGICFVPNDFSAWAKNQ